MTAGSAAYGRVCPTLSELNSDQNSYTTLGDVSAALYETVKRYVTPLRELQSAAEATQTRSETPPGQQSQIDWGP